MVVEDPEAALSGVDDPARDFVGVAGAAVGGRLAPGVSAALSPEIAWVGVGVYPWQPARRMASKMSNIGKCLGM